MPNISLLGLAAARYFAVSPLISLQPTTCITDISAIGSAMRFSFAPFIQSYSFSIRSTYYASKFANFLNHAFSYENLPSYFASTSVRSSITNTTATYRRIEFLNCYSASTGGAISIATTNIVVSVTECAFYFCTSCDYGGAIYFGASSNCTLSMICLQGMYGFYVGSISAQSPNSLDLNLTSDYNSTSYGPSQIGSLYGGTSHSCMKNNNVSRCTSSGATNYGCEWWFHPVGVDTSVTFNHFLNNSCDTLMGFHLLYQPITVSLSNFIHPTISSDGGLISFVCLNYRPTFYQCAFSLVQPANLFAKSGMTTYSVTFSYCVFDSNFSSSILVNATTIGCQFGVTISGTPMDVSELSHPCYEFSSKPFTGSYHKLSCKSVAAIVVALFALE